MTFRLMKVLLVEENSAIRGVMRQSLALPGIWIQECGNPVKAIAALAAGRADFIIMDVGTNSLDGIAACERFKVMDPAVSVILVSDYDDTVLRESAQRAGACGYVLKDNLLELKGLLTAFSTRGDGQA